MESCKLKIESILKANKRICEWANKQFNKTEVCEISPKLHLIRLIRLFTYSPIRLQKAFTLAEVLITLGIIGVVAAMTMPVLIQNQTEKTTVTRLKKIYSTFSQAFNMAVQEKGTPDEWGFNNITYDEESGYANDTNKNSSKIIFENLGKYLKLVKVCDSDSLKCIGQNEVNYTGILPDGTGFMVFSRKGDCSLNAGSSQQLQNVCGDIYVYLKGNKSNQKWGKDRFAFWITKYGIVPKGTDNSSYHTFDGTCYFTAGNSQYGENWTYGEGCTAWVIYNENMDYLHCSNLSWDGKKKCK